METNMKSLAPRKIPSDISRLPVGLTGIKLAAAGMLIMVSTSFGFSAGEPKVHIQEVPHAVSRDAFILLGSRTVGIAAGMNAAGVKFNEETDRKITSIVKSLDQMEAGIPTPVWRKISRAFHAEAIGGFWDAEDVDAMADAVLSLHRNVTEIYGTMRTSLVRAGADDADAETIAKTALVAIAYGSSGLVATNENDLHGVIGGMDTDLRDFTAVASDVCDSAWCKDEAVKEAMSSILVEGARKFREVIISSMAASPFIGPDVPKTTSSINLSQDL